MKVVCFVLIDFLIIGVPILEYILGNHLLRKRDDAEEKDAWMLTVFGWGLRAWVVINVFIKAIVLVWAIVVVLLSAESMRAAGNAMGNLSIPQ